MQSLRIQTAAQIEIKLSKHRDLGTNSPLTIFQVAYLLDVLSEEKILKKTIRNCLAFT